MTRSWSVWSPRAGGARCGWSNDSADHRQVTCSNADDARNKTPASILPWETFPRGGAMIGHRHWQIEHDLMTISTWATLYRPSYTDRTQWLTSRVRIRQVIVAGCSVAVRSGCLALSSSSSLRCRRLAPIKTFCALALHLDTRPLVRDGGKLSGVAGPGPSLSCPEGSAWNVKNPVRNFL